MSRSRLSGAWTISPPHFAVAGDVLTEAVDRIGEDLFLVDSDALGDDSPA
jgi:hypothetical protein